MHLMMITQTRVQVQVSVQVTSTLAIQNTMSTLSSSVKKLSQSIKYQVNKRRVNWYYQSRQTREIVNSRLHNPYLSLGIVLQEKPVQATEF